MVKYQGATPLYFMLFFDYHHPSLGHPLNTNPFLISFHTPLSRVAFQGHTPDKNPGFRAQGATSWSQAASVNSMAWGWSPTFSRPQPFCVTVSVLRSASCSALRF